MSRSEYRDAEHHENDDEDDDENTFVDDQAKESGKHREEQDDVYTTDACQGLKRPQRRLCSFPPGPQERVDKDLSDDGEDEP